MENSFPSIFIRLPKISGNQWEPADIFDVLEKYGKIKEVRIKKDDFREQIAIVHFNKCYTAGIKIAREIYKGNPVRVPAPYRKYFNLILLKNHKPVAKPMRELLIAPGISFGNPGQLSVEEFVFQKKQNEIAAFNFNEMFNGKTELLCSKRPRANSNVSDITMEDDFEGTPAHYYRHYQLEEGEII